jgi:LysR family pca operon transcriptional activator
MSVPLAFEASAQRVKFRHLVCFLEVARLESVMKAADALGVTQPAVSKTLHELEETLNVSLFDRAHRKISLSRFGEVFLKYAGASVTALRQGVDSIGQARTTNNVIIKVGTLPTVSARVMPRAVKFFMQESLGSMVRIATGPNTFLMAQLRLGDLDFVIGRMAEAETMTGLSFEHLYSERLAFAVRRGHPLLEHCPLDLNSVAGFTLLMPPPGSVLRPDVDRFFVANGVNAIGDQVETISSSFGRSFTRSSDAIWITSAGVVAEDVAQGYLSVLAVDTSETLGPVGLTRRADSPLSSPGELFVQAIRNAAHHIQL